MHNDSQKFSDQYLWEAFCYVAGELSTSEEECFELRMLEDGMLCQAVQYVVRQTTTIAAAQGGASQRVARVSVAANVSAPAVARSSKVFAGLVAAACCLLLAVLTASVELSPPQDEQLAENAHQAELLVSFWTNESRLDDASDPESVDLLNQEIDVPEWLYAAVALPSPNEAGSGKAKAEHVEDWF